MASEKRTDNLKIIRSACRKKGRTGGKKQAHAGLCQEDIYERAAEKM